VELAIPEHDPARPQHGALMLGGYRPAALARQLPGNALRDHPLGPGRGRGQQHVARARSAHTVVPVAGRLKVGGAVGQIRQLIEDDVGTERDHRLGEGVGVEHVADHRLSA
jgi:hypothetical protein